jgi:hypothetical protein
MTYRGHKGKFTPKNPKKYAGDPTSIIYRSSWELKFMHWCDRKDSVYSWSSEEVIIPYKSPIDNRYHRYFVDFLVKFKDTNDTTRVWLIEVKPHSKTMPPKVRKKTKRYIQEVMEWGVNDAKWKAAEQYCADRKWEFKILTEKDLNK